MLYYNLNLVREDLLMPDKFKLGMYKNDKFMNYNQ